MSSITHAQQIVSLALNIMQNEPGRPAISILDEAMKNKAGIVDIDFESVNPDYPDEVHPDYDRDDYPPSPFAELLRKAFAPDLDPSTLLFEHPLEDIDYAISQRVTDSLNIWQIRVLMPMGLRYHLDSQNWFPSVNTMKHKDGEIYVEESISKDAWFARFIGERLTWTDDNLHDATERAVLTYEENRHEDPVSTATATMNAVELRNYAVTTGKVVYGAKQVTQKPV